MPQGQNRLLPERPLLLLMDGHAMVHRAWHAIKTPFTLSKTGEDVRGVFAFANTFLKTLEDLKPSHVIMAFDTHAPTFRHQEYQEYKATRPETPQELRQQFPWIHQILEAFHIPIFEMDGFEADDILGTLSRQAQEQNMEAVILTVDTDSLQLVSPQVRVLLQGWIQGSKVYDEKAVRERYDLSPRQLIDLKAFIGDKSDNISGVPGIGPKTAVKLLQQFDSVEGIYQHLAEVNPAKLRDLLEAHRAQVLQSKHLVTIVTNVPISLNLEDSLFGRYNREEVLQILRQLEFRRIIDRIPQAERLGLAAPSQLPLEVTPRATEYATVNTPSALEETLRQLNTPQGFAFDTETTDTDPMRANLVGISFSTAPGRAWYLPLGHLSGQQLGLGEAIERLKPLMEDLRVPKTAHNANYDMTVLANYAIQVQGMDFDTMVAAFLLGEKSLGLKALAFGRLNIEMLPISALIGTGKKEITMAQVDIAQAASYACTDADMTLRLRQIFQEELERDGLQRLFQEVEMPLVPILVRVQRHGIRLNASLLQEMSNSLTQDLHRLEAEIYDRANHPFNINSPQQLSDLLFKELGLPHTKRTKTGFSTDAAVLEELKNVDQRGVVSRILEYRELAKLKSTYVDTLPTLVNPSTTRLHTTYNQTGAATGRVSSDHPNLQNIPVRTPLGRRVRTAFVAQEGWLLVAADYSQIELRILAHLSQDQGLLDAFHRDEDIHSATASSVYGVPLNQVTPDMRRVAKVMNFGVIYGLSAYGISQQTDLSADQGQQFIESYFAKYPGIKKYLELTKEQARGKGYVETILGRRRAIPEINSPTFQTRQAAERMAVNMPIQGTAADVIKLAMMRVQGRMDQLGLKSRMLLQVHDELIFEVPPEEALAMTNLLREEMSQALALSVPLKVDVKTGPTWGDLE